MCRILSALSAPESRRPRPTNRFCRGSSTRSPNGLSSSRVSSFGAVVIASMSSSDRATPVAVVVPRSAEPASPSATNTSSTPMMNSMVIG